jgi:hypothetical protein
MFEYMNRQLIWTGIADFGIFVMTVVDSGALWRWIRGVVQARRRPSAATMAAKRAIADDGKCPLCAASTGAPISSPPPASPPSLLALRRVACMADRPWQLYLPATTDCSD